jgi:hypothetical protein
MKGELIRIRKPGIKNRAKLLAACRRPRQVCDYVLALSRGQRPQLLQQLKSRRRFLDCWDACSRILSEPGAWGVAPPPRPNVDFVVNSALVVKTLQVRQQGGLRELHRFWCWPQRSSHGRDQLGYRPCTLTRGPAPKSTTTLILSRSLLPLILSPEIARRSSQKKFEPRITRIARMMRMTKMRGPRMHANAREKIN